MKAYGVWDTQENKFWHRKTKLVWGRKCDAANAWNAANSTWRKGNLKFSEQNRYIVIEVLIIPAAETNNSESFSES